MKSLVVIFFVLLFLPQINLYSQNRELLKEQARQYRKQGYNLQSVGDSQRALSFYQKAVEIDPLYVEAYNDIGVIYEEQGRLQEAEKFYQRALEIDPNFIPAYTNLAFLYEKTGDIKKSADYWKERYIRGQKGEYWHEVARQRLLRLGTYPQVRREMLEEEAARVSRELSYKRQRQRLEVIEEARLHFNVGKKAFLEGAYPQAIRNLNKALSLEPADQELRVQIRDLLREAQALRVRQNALVNTRDALKYMEDNDYFSAAERLQEALSSALHIAQ